MGTAIVRAITVGGAADAAAGLLGSRPPDLRAQERRATSLNRRDASLWRLVITAGAYVEAVRRKSPRPNEEVAESLGIPPTAVRDRIYRARHAPKPLLTGGGERGTVGRPELTAEAVRVSRERFRPLLASLAKPFEEEGFDGLGLRLDALAARLLEEQARLVPGFWDMTLEEIGEWSRARNVAPGPTDEETDIVDPTGADR